MDDDFDLATITFGGSSATGSRRSSFTVGPTGPSPDTVSVQHYFDSHYGAAPPAAAAAPFDGRPQQPHPARASSQEPTANERFVQALSGLSHRRSSRPLEPVTPPVEPPPPPPIAAAASSARASLLSGRPRLLGVDPNNGLPLLELQGALQDLFAGYVVHCYLEVTQLTFKGRYLTERAVVVTSDSLVLCGVDGRIGRVIRLQNIAKVVVQSEEGDDEAAAAEAADAASTDADHRFAASTALDGSFASMSLRQREELSLRQRRYGNAHTLAVVVPTDYDLMVQFATREDQTDFMDALNTAYRSRMHGVSLTVRRRAGEFALVYTDFNLRRPAAAHSEEDRTLPGPGDPSGVRRGGGGGWEGDADERRGLIQNSSSSNHRQLTSLAQLAQASGGGHREAEAAAAVLGLPPPPPPLRGGGGGGLVGSPEAAAEQMDRRIARLEADLAEAQGARQERETRMAGLRAALKEAEAEGRRTVSEEELVVRRHKNETITALEEQLEELQRHAFETMQPQPYTDLDLRVRHTMFQGRMPSDAVLPVSAPLGRVTRRLEVQLVQKTAELELLKKKIESYAGVQEEHDKKTGQLLWMETANLEAGLPFLTPYGAISGVHGPWPRDFIGQKKQTHTGLMDEPGGEQASHEEKRNGDAADPEQDGVVLINGINMPALGYAHVSELEVDPRTGLRLVDVNPPELLEAFCDVAGSVIHFFAPVRTKTGPGKRHVHKRILIVSDQSLYVCDFDGSIKRCVDIMHVVDCLLDETTALGLKVETEHDLLLQCMSAAHRDTIIDAIIKIQAYVNKGLHKRMVIRQLAVNQRVEEKLCLTRPPDWQFRVMPLRTKEELLEGINEKLLGGKKIEEKPEESVDDRVQREWVGVKSRMEAQFDKELAERDGEMTHLRTRVLEREERLKETATELLRLKMRIMEHHCTNEADVDVSKFEPEPLSFDPAASRYAWIPVTPVLLDTGLDVTALAFYENVVATGHANGTVQVWNTDDLSHLGTLRGHTGTVTALLFYVHDVRRTVAAAAAAPAVAADAAAAAGVAGAAGAANDDAASHVSLQTVDEPEPVEEEVTVVEVFSASHDSSVRRWKIDLLKSETSVASRAGSGGASCVPVSVLQSHRGRLSCLSLSGRALASAGDDALISLWGTAPVGAERPFKVLRGHKGAVVAVHYDGATLVSAEWGWVLMWDVAEGTVTKAFRDAYGGIRHLSVTRDFVATCGDGGDVNVWNLASGTCKTIKGTGDDLVHSQIHGCYVITAGSDCKVRSWNAATLEMAGIFHNSYPNEIRTFAFDTETFVCAEGKFLRLWLK